MTEPDSASARELLQHPDYVRFWLLRFMTVLATQVQSIAIGWQVYALARVSYSVAESALLVGMFGLAQFLPLLALSLTAGAAADRFDRRAIVALAQCADALSAITLAVLAWTGATALWPIFAVAVAFGAARAFFSPANTAMAAMIVPRRLLPRAIAWNSLAWQSGSVLGPALGGVLCGISPTLAFGVAAALYLVALMLNRLIRSDTKPQFTPGVSQTALIKEGLVYVWGNKIVFGSISLDLAAVMLAGATALLPVFARDVLHVGAEGFGILRASPAVGATVVGLYLAANPIRRRAGLAMFSGVAVFGAATVVFGLSSSMWLSVAALAVLGGADMISVYVRQTLVQLVTPDAMRGRVSAVSTVFIGASNEFGEFESGVMARFLGPVGAAVFGGTAAIIVTGVWAVLFPQLRKADRLV
jgi:MFS family permease